MALIEYVFLFPLNKIIVVKVLCKPPGTTEMEGRMTITFKLRLKGHKLLRASSFSVAFFCLLL